MNVFNLCDSTQTLIINQSTYMFVLILSEDSEQHLYAALPHMQFNSYRHAWIPQCKLRFAAAGRQSNK